MSTPAKPDPRAEGWPGDVVYLTQREWSGIQGDDVLLEVFDPDKLVVARGSTLYIVSGLNTVARQC